jgi:hypothetical protein
MEEVTANALPPSPDELPVSQMDVITIHPSVARAARAFTGLSHVQLGRSAGVASRTVFKLEKNGRITPESLAKIVSALRRKGVIFVCDGNHRATGLSFNI